MRPVTESSTQVQFKFNKILTLVRAGHAAKRHRVPWRRQRLQLHSQRRKAPRFRGEPVAQNGLEGLCIITPTNTVSEEREMFF